MTTSILKNIRKKSPSVHECAMEINEVTQKAFLLCLLENKIYQVRFFFEDDNLLTYIGYGPLKGIRDAQTNDFTLSIKKKCKNNIFIEHFFVNNKDELAIKSKELWVLFYPEGHCQEVTFSIQDKNRHFSYVLNPFSGIVEDEEKE